MLIVGSEDLLCDLCEDLLVREVGGEKVCEDIVLDWDVCLDLGLGGWGDWVGEG